jgi:hypothetical protein
MDMLAMMNALQNPRQVIMQTMLQSMVAAHPNEWACCQEMFKGKDRASQLAELKKLYASKGMDLASVAKQYGVSI